MTNISVLTVTSVVTPATVVTVTSVVTFHRSDADKSCDSYELFVSDYCGCSDECCHCDKFFAFVKCLCQVTLTGVVTDECGDSNECCDRDEYPDSDECSDPDV